MVIEQAKISIIVPVYKVPEQYLCKCIESIQAQTFDQLEIILVDDGSPDCCGDICDKYAREDSRIIVVHKKNGGLSSARNAGFLAASAKWVMFVDGDDWIDPEMCQTLYEMAEEKGVQLAMCGMTKEYGRSSQPYKYYLENDKIYSGADCKWLQEQLLHFDGNIATAYCKLIDRVLLVKHQILHDEVLRQGAEGLEFNLRLFEKLENAVFTCKPFYHYIYNEESISASHNEDNHEYVIKCFEKIQKFIEKSENKDVLMPWLYNRLLYVIITTAISGYFSPLNTESYADKKRKYDAYLDKPIIKKALVTSNLSGLSKQRKLVLWLIRHRLYRGLNLLGQFRRWQKTHK